MLNTHVLVLNKSWAAIHISSAKRALSLLFLGLARAVHPHDYRLFEFDEWLSLTDDVLPGQFVHTPNLRVRVPEVIVLTRFNGFVRYEAKFSRHSVFERDRNRCQYCGRLLPRSQLTIDHVMPQSRGGKDSWENLVVACMGCNVRKGSRTPGEANMPLLREPVRPAWLPRFGMRIPDEQILVWKRFIDTKAWRVEYEDEALPAAE